MAMTKLLGVTIDDYPPRVVRYWDAHQRWFASGTHVPPSSYAEFAKKFIPEISERTVARIRHDYPNLVGSWPLKSTERPPWELPPAESQQQVVHVDDKFNVIEGEHYQLKFAETPMMVDGKPAVRIDEFEPKSGRVVHSYIDYHHFIAAGIMGITLALDLMADGRMDHLLRWCRLVGRVVVR